VPSRPIRILLVDDSPFVRIGLAEVLGQDRGLKVIGQATTSEQAISYAQELEPDLVLLDVRIPEAGGIEAGRRILEALPNVRVLFLSAFAEEELVRAAILIGAHGYLLKEIDTQFLLQSIRRVAAGESILDPTLRHSMVDWVNRNVAPAFDNGTSLSPQEERVVRLVAEGKTNKQIAAILDLSPKTVKNYLHNVFEKLGITRRSQAAALQARRALGQLGEAS